VRLGTRIRDASPKRTTVNVASASSLTGSPPILRSIRPSTGPASRPADVKKIAGVISDRSIRPETAENPSNKSAIVAISQVLNSSALVRGNPQH
jgi:hypothetical protein